MKLTAIIEKSNDGWYVGQLEEIPAVLSQGKTIAELKENLLDALLILMETDPWKAFQDELLKNIKN
ncbi:MAG: type II toxin-antitoxin system HicB family antitoxin [Bacteroidales bacterium]|nr:type II toxin-antitoxin system HicB family antitoxin [Bacteroidales bacterium]